jgi:hypothetical protein
MKGAAMKVENVNSLSTELWYPYGRPRGTYVDQSSEGSQFDFAHFVANRSDYRRLDQVILGL